MNDRFRFRAWDEGTKIYFDNAMIETLAPISTWVKNGWVVEQCTGLKDASGKLIYEGDIIAVANGSINGNVCISKWEVVWKENDGRYSLPSWVSDKPDFSHYVKVLGNIHENPELMEDK